MVLANEVTPLFFGNAVAFFGNSLRSQYRLQIPVFIRLLRP